MTNPQIGVHDMTCASCVQPVEGLADVEREGFDVASASDRLRYPSQEQWIS